jgi:hypothetical protein
MTIDACVFAPRPVARGATNPRFIIQLTGDCYVLH